MSTLRQRARHLVWEFSGLRFMSFKRGVTTWFTFSIDWAGDHSPAFRIELALLNFILIEFGCYSSMHEDDEE